MLYREIIAVCSQIHTKHINTLCGQNVEWFNTETDGTQSSVPEDGRNCRPKHVELIVIMNKKFVIVASSWLFMLL